MGISIFAISSEPGDFIGRFINESGQELTDTLLLEYKKRFNDPEKFARWVLKYHWLMLAGCAFTAYMVSYKLASRQNLKRRVPIFMGERIVNYSLGKEIEWATVQELGKYIDTLYLLDIGNYCLGVYRHQDNASSNMTLIEEYNLKKLSEDYRKELEQNGSILP